MSEKNKAGYHVPKLRFPEFREAGEWDEKTLGDFLTESRIPGNKGDVAKKLTVKLWGNGVFAKNETTRGSVNTQYFRRKAGQFIYSKLDFLNQAFGVIPAALDNYESTVDLPCFDFLEGIDSGFLLEYVKRKDFYEKNGEEADGSRKAKRIQVEAFLTFPILVPELVEQQKIADCLASLDELITLEAQKLDTLKTHKKGLMQQLFPAEGETLPKLRFPEFQDAGEWESKSLDKYFDKIRNGFVGTATPYYVADGIPYLQGKNIKQGKIDPTGLVHISRDFHKSQNKSQLDAADVLMVQSGHVGECALVSEQFSGSNCHALIVLSPCGKVDSRFFVHYFYSPQGQARIFVITTGNTIKHILASDLRVLEITAPTFEEQQQIADCLASLDDLIAAQTQKLAALKTQKKGLMQQLFPALDAEVWP